MLHTVGCCSSTLLQTCKILSPLNYWCLCYWLQASVLRLGKHRACRPVRCSPTPVSLEIFFQSQGEGGSEACSREGSTLHRAFKNDEDLERQGTLPGSNSRLWDYTQARQASSLGSQTFFHSHLPYQHSSGFLLAQVKCLTPLGWKRCPFPIHSWHPVIISITATSLLNDSAFNYI